MRRFDRVEVLVEPRLVLRGLAGEESVEVVEPVPRRPSVERPHRGGLVGGRVVPLAEGRGLVTVVVQHLRDRGGRPGDHAGVAVPVDGTLGDGPVADPLMVPPGQQRGARRRTDRGGVERVVADPVVREAGQRRCVDLAAEGVGQAEADVVEQDDEDVGRGLQAMRARHADGASTAAASRRRRSPTASAGTAGPSHLGVGCPCEVRQRQRRRSDADQRRCAGETQHDVVACIDGARFAVEGASSRFGSAASRAAGRRRRCRSRDRRPSCPARRGRPAGP